MTCLKHNIGHTKPFPCFTLILGGNGSHFLGAPRLTPQEKTDPSKEDKWRCEGRSLEVILAKAQKTPSTKSEKIGKNRSKLKG